MTSIVSFNFNCGLGNIDDDLNDVTEKGSTESEQTNIRQLEGLSKIESKIQECKESLDLNCKESIRAKFFNEAGVNIMYIKLQKITQLYTNKPGYTEKIKQYIKKLDNLYNLIKNSSKNASFENRELLESQKNFIQILYQEKTFPGLSKADVQELTKIDGDYNKGYGKYLRTGLEECRKNDKFAIILERIPPLLYRIDKIKHNLTLRMWSNKYYNDGDWSNYELKVPCKEMPLWHNQVYCYTRAAPEIILNNVYRGFKKQEDVIEDSIGISGFPRIVAALFTVSIVGFFLIKVLLKGIITLKSLCKQKIKFANNNKIVYRKNIKRQEPTEEDQDGINRSGFTRDKNIS